MQQQQNLHMLLTVGVVLALVKAVVMAAVKILVLTAVTIVVVVVVTIITTNFSDIFNYVKGLYKL